jgi:hypothetical protein
MVEMFANSALHGAATLQQAQQVTFIVTFMHVSFSRFDDALEHLIIYLFLRLFSIFVEMRAELCDC